MKVACATPFMMEFFRDIYPDIFALGKNKDGDDLDLLIFTGGQDLNPVTYDEPPSGAYGWSDNRDMLELRIFNRWREKKLRAKKVLGVCRGIQLLNVALGGSLYQDIYHPGRHTITWNNSTEMSYLTEVNSMHHQAVKRLGGGFELAPIVLAVEPETSIPEVVAYGDSIFAVQFHPELFGGDNKKNFFSVINNWVNGEYHFVETPKKESSWRGMKLDWSTTSTTSAATLDYDYERINDDFLRRLNRDENREFRFIPNNDNLGEPENDNNT